MICKNTLVFYFYIQSRKGFITLKENVGLIDRIIRIILGLILLSLFFLLDGGIKYISIIGIVLLLTAFIKSCPIYSILGINSRSIKK